MGADGCQAPARTKAVARRSAASLAGSTYAFTQMPAPHRTILDSTYLPFMSFLGTSIHGVRICSSDGERRSASMFAVDPSEPSVHGVEPCTAFDVLRKTFPFLLEWSTMYPRSPADDAALVKPAPNGLGWEARMPCVTAHATSLLSWSVLHVRKSNGTRAKHANAIMYPTLARDYFDGVPWSTHADREFSRDIAAYCLAWNVCNDMGLRTRGNQHSDGVHHAALVSPSPNRPLYVYRYFHRLLEVAFSAYADNDFSTDPTPYCELANNLAAYAVPAEGECNTPGAMIAAFAAVGAPRTLAQQALGTLASVRAALLSPPAHIARVLDPWLTASLEAASVDEVVVPTDVACAVYALLLHPVWSPCTKTSHFILSSMRLGNPHDAGAWAKTNMRGRTKRSAGLDAVMAQTLRDNYEETLSGPVSVLAENGKDPVAGTYASRLACVDCSDASCGVANACNDAYWQAPPETVFTEDGILRGHADRYRKYAAMPQRKRLKEYAMHRILLHVSVGALHTMAYGGTGFSHAHEEPVPDIVPTDVMIDPKLLVADPSVMAPYLGATRMVDDYPLVRKGDATAAEKMGRGTRKRKLGAPASHLGIKLYFPTYANSMSLSWPAFATQKSNAVVSLPHTIDGISVGAAASYDVDHISEVEHPRKRQAVFVNETGNLPALHDPG